MLNTTVVRDVAVFNRVMERIMPGTSTARTHELNGDTQLEMVPLPAHDRDSVSNAIGVAPQSSDSSSAGTNGAASSAASPQPLEQALYSWERWNANCLPVRRTVSSVVDVAVVRCTTAAHSHTHTTTKDSPTAAEYVDVPLPYVHSGAHAFRLSSTHASILERVFPGHDIADILTHVHTHARARVQVRRRAARSGHATASLALPHRFLVQLPGMLLHAASFLCVCVCVCSGVGLVLASDTAAVPLAFNIAAAVMLPMGVLLLLATIAARLAPWGLQRLYIAAAASVVESVDAVAGSAGATYRVCTHTEDVFLLQHVSSRTASVVVRSATQHFLRISARDGRPLHTGLSLATHGFVPGTACVPGVDGELLPCRFALPAGAVVVDASDFMSPVHGAGEDGPRIMSAEQEVESKGARRRAAQEALENELRLLAAQATESEEARV